MSILPPIGIGTSQNTDPTDCAKSIETAIEMGYRHVDTAQMYNNETYVGNGLAQATVDRDDVIVATKINEGNYSYDGVIEATEASVNRLGVETIDLLYVHWPTTNYDPEETLPAFDELRDTGVIRHIGVSNFNADQVEKAVEVLDAPLVANQVEMHPLLPPQESLLESARRHHYQLVAYSPFCRTAAFGFEPIVSIAETYGVSEAQVILAWLWSFDGVVAIPKGTSEAHIRDNLTAVGLELSDEELERINAIQARRRLIDRDEAPWNQTNE